MSNSQPLNVNLILSVGTQVVAGIEVKRPTGEVLCLRGAVGVVVEAPTDNSHAYQELLDIRWGKTSWQEVNTWRLSLHQELDSAFTATNLPERPKYEQANTFLIEARRGMVSSNQVG